MGALADSMFAVLMSWVRALVNSLWALLSSERTSTLEFLGKNWLLIAIILVAAGLIIDWIIWMIRWKPYALRGRMRKAREKEEEEEIDARAMEMFGAYGDDVREDEYDDLDDDVQPTGEEDDSWLPERPVLSEAEEEQAFMRADEVSDEELGVYPGMRYDEQAQRPQTEEEMGGTRRYAAVHQEGPGAAEVNRRRAEIDAWQQQMQDEARAERMRRMEEMRRAEEERLAEEARAAEEARLAEETRAAEEARLAQEEYQHQLEEYEREKVRYEAEMAQYQRDLAAYEAAMAAHEVEAAQEIAPQQAVARVRTRRRAATYSDIVEGEAVDQLPGSPAWPKMEETVSQVRKAEAGNKKAAKGGGLIGKMAHLIEPEREEISGVNALPPRVDPRRAYKPAAKPENAPNRRRK